MKEKEIYTEIVDVLYKSCENMHKILKGTCTIQGLQKSVTEYGFDCLYGLIKQHKIILHG